MSDFIQLYGVSTLGMHGVLPHERQHPQPFVVDVDMEVDLSVAGHSDDLTDTISYAEVASDIVAVVEGPAVNLIENLAEKIAEKVLARGALSTIVTVHKPQAPVGISFHDVSVRIHRYGPLRKRDIKARKVVIALGSNLGDKAANIRKALQLIAQLPVYIVSTSQLMSTAAQLAEGQEPQPDYMNAVSILTTALPPLDLLKELQDIEIRCGRVREGHWGPRLIDIDIIDICGVTSIYSKLILPHPRACERLFVLQPWAELEPDAQLAGISIRERIDTLLGDELHNSSPGGR